MFYIGFGILERFWAIIYEIQQFCLFGSHLGVAQTNHKSRNKQFRPYRIVIVNSQLPAYYIGGLFVPKIK